MTSLSSSSKRSASAKPQPVRLPAVQGGVKLDRESAALLQDVPLRALLIQSALLAELHGMVDQADVMRAVVVRLGISAVLFDVARSIVMLQREQPEAAARVIERDVLPVDPGHELGRAVLVCAWRQMGRSDWHSHANSLLAASTDPRVRQLLLEDG
jgi:hypothetical protein